MPATPKCLLFYLKQLKRNNKKRRISNFESSLLLLIRFH